VLIKKFKCVPNDYKEKIKGLSEETLDVLATDIFDIEKIEDIKIVVSGAGAAAISCSKLYVSLGVRMENIVMADSKGVINRNRTDLNDYKKEFITDRDIDTLTQAMKGVI